MLDSVINNFWKNNADIIKFYMFIENHNYDWNGETALTRSEKQTINLTTFFQNGLESWDFNIFEMRIILKLYINIVHLFCWFWIRIVFTWAEKCLSILLGRVLYRLLSSQIKVSSYFNLFFKIRRCRAFFFRLQDTKFRKHCIKKFSCLMKEFWLWTRI
jgi:hypothetical protein